MSAWPLIAAFAAGWITCLLWRGRYEVAERLWAVLDRAFTDPRPVEPVAPARPTVRLVWSATRDVDGAGGDAA